MNILQEIRSLELELELLEAKKKSDIPPKERNRDYFPPEMADSTAAKRDAHFKRQSKMSDDNPKAYKPAPGDKRPPNEPKQSKWTKKFKDMYGESDMDESGFNYAAAKAAMAGEKTFKFGGEEHPVKMSKEKAKQIVDEAEVVKEMLEIAEEILNEGEVIEEKMSKKTRTALKNKAEKANAPLGALTQVYNKGLAAWKTGHRPGANQHAWAMGRVNSFLAGGPARKVDSAQWNKVKKHRKKK
jgi:hypothetical protein